jgi:hypothetical protein
LVSEREETNMARRIKVSIPRGGAVKMEVVGACGPGCMNLTRGIEQALGTVVSDEQKPEYVDPVTELEEDA